MIDNPLCLLAIEEKPNSFMPINLSDLGIDNVSGSYCTLKEVDNIIFTYGEDYILSMLDKTNVLDKCFLEGKLVILVGVNNTHKKLPLISKKMYENYNIKNVISDNIENKVFVNQVLNKVRNLKIDDVIKNNLNTLFKSGNLEIILIYYDTLPYIVQRELYLIIVNILIKLEEKNVIIRERKETE